MEKETKNNEIIDSKKKNPITRLVEITIDVDTGSISLVSDLGEIPPKTEKYIESIAIIKGITPKDLIKEIITNEVNRLIEEFHSIIS